MALGYLPERLLHSRGTPRLLFLPAMSALMSAACLALAFAPLRMLYPLAALTGFAFGAQKGPCFPALQCPVAFQLACWRHETAWAGRVLLPGCACPAVEPSHSLLTAPSSRTPTALQAGTGPCSPLWCLSCSAWLALQVGSASVHC